MHKLLHFRLCPHSRSIRAALAELRIEVEAIEERPWEWKASLVALNPAGELPVLVLERGLVLCGAYAISEYLGDGARGHMGEGFKTPLFPERAEERAEVRRLIDWFQGKFHREVTRELLEEKIYGFMKPGSGHVPDPEILRAVRANLRHHLAYVNHLANHRRWLAGEEMSFADFAAAAHVSCIDYLGEVPWEDYPLAKTWYGRMKSRPAFRSILADRIPGAPPPQSYADLDF